MHLSSYRLRLITPQRWLLEHGHDDEAHTVVLRLHGAHTDKAPAALKERAELEYAEMHDAIHAEMHVRSRHIRDLWASRAMIRRTLVAVGVQIFGQCTGINGECAGDVYATSTI